MACRAGGAARRRGRDHQPRPARAARSRAARDLRDAGARRCRRDLPRQPALVALAAGRGRALVRGLAGERPRAGRGGRRADRTRLPRRRLGDRNGRTRLVDSRRPRLSRGARHRARLGDAERAAGHEHARAGADSRSPPAGRCRASSSRPSAHAYMGWLDLLAPALLGVVVAGRTKLGAAVVTGLAAGLWGLLFYVTSEVAATVPVLAGLAYAAVDARRSRLRHPLEPARAGGGPRGDRGGGA